MTESIRPSASEEARAAARAAENKKTKQTLSKAGQQGAQAAGLTQDKKLKSANFDELLKNASEPSMPVLTSETKFDSRVREIHKEEERSSSDRDSSEDDKKSGDKTGTAKKDKEGALSARERVVGKQSSREQQGESGSGSGKREDGQSQQRGLPKDSEAQAFSAGMKRRESAPAFVPMEAPRTQAPIAAPESAAAPRELPKALLDQIVQSVTIIQRKDLNKEIQIDFHDKIFNGLKLKVLSHGGEVSIEFLVPNRSVEETFKQERENIALALGEKGVDVRSINVSRLG
ncbi:MAG TPA: hypothetical protein DF383_00035 [Deltaproteobacteria bacterium]|nr:hypothetical protein [Deltaproteobacteria bacterium]